jgi:SAM-dependent methyltransferase
VGHSPAVPGRRLYDTLYRFGAPWEGPARDELVNLVRSGRLTPETFPPGRAIDLGCGSGANAIFLADHGFDVTGVDFSPIALQKARITAKGRPGRRIQFVRGDLTATEIPGVPGPFDLLVDYGTLDDLKGTKRQAMARTITRLARPGAAFLLWCFYGNPAALPRFSLKGVSRPFAGLSHGEERGLFAEAFDIETLAKPARGEHGHACFLMTQR